MFIFEIIKAGAIEGERNYCLAGFLSIWPRLVFGWGVVCSHKRQKAYP